MAESALYLVTWFRRQWLCRGQCCQKHSADAFQTAQSVQQPLSTAMRFPLAQINEFHRAPTPFFFTSPLNSSVLPTLRVSGEGVLKEFGFQAHRFWGDVFAVVACGAFLHPSIWSIKAS